MDRSAAAPSSTELLDIQERVTTFSQVLASQDANDPEANAFVEELYASCIKETQERLTILVNQYIDAEDPALVADLMRLYDEVAALDTQYKKSRAAGQAASVLRSSFEFFNSPIAPAPPQMSATAPPPQFSGDLFMLPETLQQIANSATPASSSSSSSPSAPPVNVAPPPPQKEPQPAVVAPTRPAPEPEEEEVLPAITCPICFDDVEGKDCHKIKACGHQYCQDCLEDFLEVRVKDGTVLEIKCPDPKCQGTITYNEVARIITDDTVFAKYEEFTLLAALKAEPNLRWCPKPGCGNAMIGSEDYPRMVCTKPGCGHVFCFKCGEDWHTGTCEQYAEWKKENSAEEKKYGEWAKEHTKPCPKCKALIEKNSGCNHMTCVHCHHQFCWLCGGDYTPNHYALYNVLGCPAMQFTSDGDHPVTFKNSALSFAKRMGMRALIGTGAVVGGAVVAALAVPTLLIAAPVYGGIKLVKSAKRATRKRRRERLHYWE